VGKKDTPTAARNNAFADEQARLGTNLSLLWIIKR